MEEPYLKLDLFPKEGEETIRLNFKYKYIPMVIKILQQELADNEERIFTFNEKGHPKKRTLPKRDK